MKKLGTPDSDPPSVDGSGGVSAEGETAFALGPASPFFSPLVPDLPEDFDPAEPPCPWPTTVECCECCARTSGAGTVVVPLVVVEVGVVMVVVPVPAVPVVALSVTAPVGMDWEGGGAGTVVTSEAGGEVCVEGASVA